MTNSKNNKVLKQTIIDAIKTVYDPEIPVNIYDLGLIYDIAMKDENVVHIQMTLTSPHCPVAESLPLAVEAAVNAVPTVSHCTVEIVWEPPWTMDSMSEAARLELGLFD